MSGQGAYEIIYADPPWSYRDKAGRRGAASKYDLMSVDNICRFDVQSLCAPNATLFMWATMPLLPEGIRVMESWGFTWKTVAFVWVKANKKAGTPFWGMGSWTRANAELVLLGVKGKPKRINAGVHQVVDAPEIRSPIERHSRKPDEIRNRIVTLMGDLPRVELFAREAFEGWDLLGNDPAVVEHSIELPYRADHNQAPCPEVIHPDREIADADQSESAGQQDKYSRTA